MLQLEKHWDNILPSIILKQSVTCISKVSIEQYTIMYIMNVWLLVFEGRLSYLALLRTDRWYLSV